jgi:hypothetical protein
MNDDLDYLPPAETGYKDWVGTAAAETSVVGTSGSLSDLAGLDDSSVIVAIDAWTFSHGEDPDWTVHISAVAGADWENQERIVAERGSLPVRNVQVDCASLDDVIRCMKVVHFQLRLPHAPVLDVVERTNHPPVS